MLRRKWGALWLVIVWRRVDAPDIPFQPARYAAARDLITSGKLQPDAEVAVISGHGLSPAMLLAPLFCFGLVVTAAAAGTLLCALTVMFRDFRYAVPFGLQLWMYATPIVYPASMFPEQWRALSYLNPATGFIEGFRASMCGLPIPWRGVATSSAAALVLLAVALMVFARVERRLVDRL